MARPALAARAAITLVLPLLALASGSAPSAQGCDNAIEYGINPSFHTWTSRAIVFADGFQRVREMSYWGIGPGAPAPLLPYGNPAAGWPDPAQLPAGQRYGAPLFNSMEGTLPDGRSRPYVVTWRGDGHVQLEGAYVVGERNRRDHRVEVSIDPTLGTGNSLLACTWTARDPANPVRDVHVWLPGTEPDASGRGPIFWPPFVAKLKEMNAGRGPETLRTLDWTRVNDVGRPLVWGGFTLDLQGLITPASPSQGTLRGVAVEYQVALCNELGMNLHWQAPHRTDDLTVAQYQLLLRDQLERIRSGSPGVPGVNGGRPFEGLRSGLTVTVELSNEMWNSLFPVNDWMYQRAQALGIPFREQVAREIQQLFDVARDVFAGAHAGRLRTYVAGFVADATFLDALLRRLRPGTRVDAVGAAAYMGPRRPDMDAWLEGATPGSCPNCPDADELLAVALRTIGILRPQIAQHEALALDWTNPDGSHADLELYEAGLNLKSMNQPWDQAARELQTRHELFVLLNDRFVPMLVQEGVTRVHWYSFMTDQDSPQLDAYGFWNDMNQEITQPVARPVLDEGAPKAAFLCYGPPLSPRCPGASATLRMVAGNVDSFRTGVPVLGRWLELSVDLTTTGHQAAVVLYSPNSTSVPVPSGGTLLSGLGGAETLPLTPGPIARWRVPVPNAPELAGLQLFAQAIHLGGQPDPALSNGIDLVLGR
jgi:hypothetical protein